MERGQYYDSNQKRFIPIQENDWKVALVKTKNHIKWKLKQKTLFGVHTATNLGTDPIEHYLNLSYDKLLTGEWEWKEEYSLAEQMIRIVNSYTFKEVAKSKTKKADSFKIEYKDIEEEFYNMGESEDEDHERENEQYENQVKLIESGIQGDIELEIMWDGLKEGKKRREIAEFLEITPKQFDKVKERFFRRVKIKQDTAK